MAAAAGPGVWRLRRAEAVRAVRPAAAAAAVVMTAF